MRNARAAAVVLSLAAPMRLDGQDGPYHAGPVMSIGDEGGWDYRSVDIR
jgi:hypothetical protein